MPNVLFVPQVFDDFYNVIFAGMESQLIFILIILILFIEFGAEKLLDFLNLRHRSHKLPPEAEGIYDAEKYRKSTEYYKANYRFSAFSSSCSFILMLAVLFLDGFAVLDNWVRNYTTDPVVSALLYFTAAGLISDIFGTPFELYKLFVIEERFGFNKTTWKTYLADKLKGYAVALLLGSLLIGSIVWIYGETGNTFWLLAWAVVAGFMLLATLFYSSVILPLFNKLTPLPEGNLRNAIVDYCNKVGFKLDNLFVMDGSKRSTKANAFFSGLGPKKRIVLYDTLIEKHTQEEIVAVLAHEVGHYKKKHTMTSMILGVLQTGITFYILSLFLGNPELSKALGANQSSFHIDIIAFGILYSPLSELLGIFMNLFSRKNEYEADRYAKETFGGKPLADALKKLSSDSLSNLTPHPAYVFVHYSHPPLLQRLKRLNDEYHS